MWDAPGEVVGGRRRAGRVLLCDTGSLTTQNALSKTSQSRELAELFDLYAEGKQLLALSTPGPRPGLV